MYSGANGAITGNQRYLRVIILLLKCYSDCLNKRLCVEYSNNYVSICHLHTLHIDISKYLSTYYATYNIPGSGGEFVAIALLGSNP